MSTTIDQRVAELRFDNSHFEKNVATSMSTLEKLKQKLNLTGASKGLEDLGTAAKKVDMSPITKGAEAVRVKFSALHSMTDQYFRNLESRIEQAARNFVKMFTVDPVKTGFNEYELKMGSIQTIMASTGESLEKVNGYLNELNTYSDKTIYSFSDMTQNIGKFTNAGVKLEDAVAAIQGISNEAALSGANANEASRAMYNFAQALSSGFVKLIDWKSIENANMATVGFKEELIKTAVEMKTLTKTTDGYKTAEGKVITATKNFNDSLQDQWMTSDVLITTLKRYSDETTEIGKKATKAATEVKTFSQMMDSLKESAQSGWAQTWEIIFGDFEEGKTLWTSIYNVASKVIDKMSDVRNNLLRGALNPWDKLVKKVNDVGISTEKFSDTVKAMAKEAGIPIDELIEKHGTLANVIKMGKIPAEIFRKAIKKLIGAEDDLNKSTDTVAKTVKDLDEVVKRVIRGEFGNGAERVKKLTEAGYDWATVQNKVNEILGSSVRHTSKVTEAQKEQLNQLAKLDDETLKNKGYTEEQIKTIRELAEAADGAGTSIGELIASLEKPSGRELLIDSFKNLGETAKEIFKIIGDAWKNIFGSKTENEKSQSIYNLIEKFHDLTESMTFSEEAAKRFQNILEGVFSAVDLSWSLASMSVMGGLKILNEVLRLFGTDLTQVLEWVALKIKDLNQWVEDLAFFGANTKWADFGKVIHAILVGLKDCLKALFELERFKEMAKRFKKTIAELFDFDADINFLSVENIVNKITDFFGKVKNWIQGMDNAENIGVYIVEGLAKGIWSGIRIVGEAILGIGKAVIDAICGFFGINSPAKAFIKIGKYCIEGLVLGFKNMNAGKIIKVITNVGKLILNTIKNFLGIHSPSTKFQEIAKNCIDGFILGFKNGISVIGGYIKTFAMKCVEVIQKIDWGKLISIGLSVGLIVTMKKLSDTLQTFISPFKAVGDGIGHLLTSIGDGLEAKFKAQALDKKAGAILKIAIAIGILVAAIVVMTKIPVGQLWATIGALGVLAGIIIGLSIACEKLNGIGDFGLKSASLLAIGGTILALAGSLKILSTIDLESGKNALLYLAGIVVALGVFVVAIGTLMKGPVAENVHKVGKLIGKLAWALLLMVGVVKLASMLDDSTVKRGIGVIALVSSLFMAIIAVTKLVGPTDAKKVGQMLTKMSFALLIMVGVIKLASMLDKSEVNRGLGVIAAVGLLFTGLIAVSRLAGEHASKAGGMLLKISGALLLMMWVVKMAGSMSKSELTKGAAIITAFGIVIAGLVAVSKYAGAEASAAGNMLLKAAIAMLIMSAVLIILKELDPEGIGKAMGIIAGLSAIYAGLIYVTKYAGDADKVKGTLITLTIAIGILAVALIALSFLDPSNVAVASAALSSIVGVFALLIKATEHLKTSKVANGRTIKTILILTLVVAALGGVIYALSTIDNPQAALIASGALSVLLLSLATSMEIISKSKSFTPGKLGKIAAALGILSGVMIVLASVLWAMSALNVQNAIPNAIALSGMIFVLSIVVQNLSLLDGRRTNGLIKAAGCMALLAGVMGILAGVLVIMNTLNVGSAVTNAVILSGLILVLTGVAALLSLFGNQAANIAMGALGLAALVGVMALLGLVLAMMTALNVKDAMTNALALSILMGVLTGVAAALALIGMALPTIAAGALGLAALAGVMALLGLVLAMMTALNVKDAMANAASLSILLLSMSAALGILALVGLAAPAALAGIGCLATFIVAVGALIAAIGALVTKFPQLEEFLDRGIPILVKIGTGIGEFFGAIIGGFVGGIGVMLPILGTQLSAFMTNVMPFIQGAKLVDESVLKGVGILAASVLALTVADLINSVSSIFGVSLPMLGLELSAFMRNAIPFITGATMITPAMVEGVKSLAEVILILTGAGLLEGLSRLLGGGSSIEQFAVQLPLLGKGLNGFITSLGSVTEDQLTSANNAAEIIKTLAKASSEIPNAGGLLGSLVGENDMGPWAKQLPILAEGIVAFSNKISEAELTDEQVDMANKAAKIVKTLAGAASEIPNAGGLLADLIGDNDFSAWSKQLPVVASGIAGFCSKLTEVELSEDQVEIAKKAASIIKTLAKASAEIPNAGGLLAQLVGDNDLTTWAKQLPNVGKGVAGFANELGTFGEDKLATVNSAVNAVKVIAKMSNEYDALNDMGDFSGFGNGMIKLAKKVKEFVEKLNEVSSESVSSAVNKVKQVLKLAQTVADTEIGSLKTFGTSLKDIAEEGIKGFVEAFTDEKPKDKIKKAAKSLADNFIKGLEDKTDGVKKACTTLANKASKGIATKETKDAFKQAGKDLGSGLVKGIEAKEDAVYKAAYKLGQKAVQGEKDGQASNSPSKLTILAGKWLGEGLIIGMNKMNNLVYKSGSNLGSTATNTISSAIATITDRFNTDIDSQPTIRPVLDLSDVTAGASTISGLFNNPSMGVMANVRAISSSMNNNQNGGNGDIVSAINKLRKDLGNVGGTTNYIDGINVGNDEEINNAIGTLVRAARMGGRA